SVLPEALQSTAQFAVAPSQRKRRFELLAQGCAGLPRRLLPAHSTNCQRQHRGREPQRPCPRMPIEKALSASSHGIEFIVYSPSDIVADASPVRKQKTRRRRPSESLFGQEGPIRLKSGCGGHCAGASVTIGGGPRASPPW